MVRLRFGDGADAVRQRQRLNKIREVKGAGQRARLEPPAGEGLEPVLNLSGRQLGGKVELWYLDVCRS